MNNDTQGKVAEKFFNAYNEQGPNPWKTWDGKDVPRWHQLNDQVRAKWCAVAKCAMDMSAENELDYL